MTRKEFEALVAEGFLRLPEKFRRKIKNMGFLVEDEPSAELRREVGLREDETLLGFYRGIPRAARGEEYGVGPTLPDTITIFQKATEEEARERVSEFSNNIHVYTNAESADARSETVAATSEGRHGSFVYDRRQMSRTTPPNQPPAGSPDASSDTFREAVREVVSETVWHEVGHYFGLDEEEVRRQEEKHLQLSANPANPS